MKKIPALQESNIDVSKLKRVCIHLPNGKQDVCQMKMGIKNGKFFNANAIKRSHLKGG